MIEYELYTKQDEINFKKNYLLTVKKQLIELKHEINLKVIENIINDIDDNINLLNSYLV